MADIANWPSSAGDASLPAGETGDVIVTDGVTNATSVAQTIRHRTTGTAAAGIGVGLAYEAQNAAGADVIAATERAVLTTATGGAEVGAFRIGVINAGAATAEGSEQFEVSPTGVRMRVGLILPIVTKTGNYTLTSTDYHVLADASSAANTQTLPAASANTGRVFIVTRINSPGNNVTVATVSGNIGGAATAVLAAQYQSIKVQSDGTNYYVC